MNCQQALVASSDMETRTALVEVLAQCGLESLTAANIKEVQAVLAQRPVQLVFCEDGLPGGGFREVLRMARESGSVPLVVCSLLGNLDEYLEAMELGAFDFIAPPYRRAEVESITNSVRQTYLSKPTGGTCLDTPAEGDEAVA